MKQKIRAIRLNRLLNTPLSENLQNISMVADYIESFLIKLEVKSDKIKYGNSTYYFIQDEFYFEVDYNYSSLTCLFYRKNLFDDLPLKYLDIDSVVELVEFMFNEHFNLNTVYDDCMHMRDEYIIEIENYFNKMTQNM